MRVALNDADVTASPNAGWPMAAMAGALGVRLREAWPLPTQYAGAAAAVRDIARARRIVLLASGLAALAVDVT